MESACLFPNDRTYFSAARAFGADFPNPRRAVTACSSASEAIHLEICSTARTETRAAGAPLHNDVSTGAVSDEFGIPDRAEPG